MSEALIKVEDAGLPMLGTDGQFEALVSGEDFLPSIRLMTAKSEKCSEGFPINHFALIANQDYQDIGDKVDCVVVASRPTFIDTGGDEIVVIHRSAFNEANEVTDPTALSIMERSFESNSGCMYGPEFLLWLPDHNIFACLFMGSKSARREAKVINLRKGLGSSLIPKKIQSKRYAPWFIPTLTECSTITNLPDAEAVTKAVKKFSEDKGSNVEVAEETTSERER